MYLFALTVLSPHACTISFPTRWVISLAHMFLLAHFLAQMKPGATPSVHRATLFQSLHASSLSVRPPFPSGASVPLLKCVCPCPLELGFLIPSSKLRAWVGIGPQEDSSMVFNLCHAESHLSCAISVSLQQLGQHSLKQKEWGKVCGSYPSLHISLSKPQWTSAWREEDT